MPGCTVCGYVVEWVRSCYVSSWRLFNNSNVETVGRYVFAPEGTPHYPAPHYFGSRNWTQGAPDDQERLGEVRDATHAYSLGDWQGNYPPAGLIGSQECIQSGETWPLPVIERSLEGGWDSRCFALPRPAPPPTPINVNVRWCPTQYQLAVVCELLYQGNGLAGEQELQRLYPMATISRVGNTADFVPGSLIAVSGSTAVVVVSGTTTPQQWALQGMFGTAGLFDYGTYGTLLPWHAASNVILDRMDAAGVDYNGSVVFVGHSYGGAIASILAFRVARNQLGPRVQLLTFGSPKPGDERLIAGIDALPAVHLVNDFDPIPYVPPSGPELALILPIAPTVMVGRWQGWRRPLNRIGQREDGTRYDAPEWESVFNLVYTLALQAIAGDTPDPITPHNSGTYVNRIRCPASPSPTPATSGIWYTPAGLDQYAAGALVPLWPDESGHANDALQAQILRRPVVVEGLNGFKGAMMWNVRRMVTTAQLELGSRHTVLLVCSTFGTGVNRRGPSVTGGDMITTSVINQPGGTFNYFDTISFASTPLAIDNGFAGVWCIHRDDAQLDFLFNGEVLGSTTIDPNGTAAVAGFGVAGTITATSGGIVLHELRILDQAVGLEAAVYLSAELVGKYALLP